MDLAYCSALARNVSIDELESFPHSQFSDFKKQLLCPECAEVAWHCSATNAAAKVKRNAHFNSHHKDDTCSYKTSFRLVEDEQDSDKTADTAIPLVAEYTINLDEKIGGKLADLSLEPIPASGFSNAPTGGGFAKGKSNSKETSSSRTLRQLLSYLKRFEDFRNSNKSVTIYSDTGKLKVNGCVKDVVVNFDDIRPSLDDNQNRIFWGVIVDAGLENSGGIWLNASGSKQGLSVKIYSDIKKCFENNFNINDLNDLKGAHVLVVGKLHYTGKHNKPIVYCALVNLITMQRYRN
jgi:hypothetical protein